MICCVHPRSFRFLRSYDVAKGPIMGIVALMISMEDGGAATTTTTGRSSGGVGFSSSVETTTLLSIRDEDGWLVS